MAGRILEVNVRQYISPIARIGLASLFMTLLLLYLRLQLPLPVCLVIGFIGYFCMIILLRGLNRNGFDRHKAYGEWLNRFREILE